MKTLKLVLKDFKEFAVKAEYPLIE